MRTPYNETTCWPATSHVTLIELEASLTPTATAAEQKRAWNFNLACLQNQACGEICDVMPDAWRDFYVGRGHFDVEKYGPAYLFCKNPPP